MYTEDYSKIRETLAKKEGTNEKTVAEEMEKAILEGYNSKDPQVREAWEKLFPGMERAPTPEEFITAVRDEAVRKTNEKNK